MNLTKYENGKSQTVGFHLAKLKDWKTKDWYQVIILASKQGLPGFKLRDNKVR